MSAADRRGHAGCQDPESAALIGGLRSSGPEHAAALSRLHELVWDVARREAARRSGQARSAAGPDPEFLPAGLDFLARRATAGALRAIITELGSFDGKSQVTTWAGKYAVSAVSEHAARSAAALRGPGTVEAEQDWEHLADRLGLLPHERAGWDEFAAALRQAVDGSLSDERRRVFTAVTVAGVPADVLAAGLGSSRHAVYQALFEARRAVRARLAADGRNPAHHCGSFSAWPRWAGGLLAADPGDAGCEVTFSLADRYAEAELRGPGAARRFPAVAAHLRSCRACEQDHRGLLAAAAG